MCFANDDLDNLCDCLFVSSSSSDVALDEEDTFKLELCETLFSFLLTLVLLIFIFITIASTRYSHTINMINKHYNEK